MLNIVLTYTQVNVLKVLKEKHLMPMLVLNYYILYNWILITCALM